MVREDTASHLPVCNAETQTQGSTSHSESGEEEPRLRLVSLLHLDIPSASCLQAFPTAVSSAWNTCSLTVQLSVALGPLHPLLRPDACSWAGPALAPLPPALAVPWDSGLGSHTC